MCYVMHIIRWLYRWFLAPADKCVLFVYGRNPLCFWGGNYNVKTPKTIISYNPQIPQLDVTCCTVERSWTCLNNCQTSIYQTLTSGDSLHLPTPPHTLFAFLFLYVSLCVFHFITPFVLVTPCTALLVHCVFLSLFCTAAFILVFLVSSKSS